MNHRECISIFFEAKRTTKKYDKNSIIGEQRVLRLERTSSAVDIVRSAFTNSEKKLGTALSMRKTPTAAKGSINEHPRWYTNVRA